MEPNLTVDSGVFGQLRFRLIAVEHGVAVYV